MRLYADQHKHEKQWDEGADFKQLKHRGSVYNYPEEQRWVVRCGIDHKQNKGRVHADKPVNGNHQNSDNIVEVTEEFVLVWECRNADLIKTRTDYSR